MERNEYKTYAEQLHRNPVFRDIVDSLEREWREAAADLVDVADPEIHEQERAVIVAKKQIIADIKVKLHNAM